ncbi:MAG TPA: hypothetical protein VF747_08860, partial [Blastocatellia bacterium]
QLFCVYHRWAEDGSDRVLAIDRQDWAGKRMIILGPTTTPQPAPARPALYGFSGDEWRRDKGWALKDGALVQGEENALVARASYATEIAFYVLELSLKSLNDPSKEGLFGLELSGAGHVFRFSLSPESKEAVITGGTKNSGEQRFKLPPEFDVTAFHLLRVEVNGDFVSIALDSLAIWQDRIDAPPHEVALLTQKVSAAFAGLALTYGWEDLFMGQAIYPSEMGWKVEESSGHWSIRDQALWSSNDEDQRSSITKGPLFGSYELVVNARLNDASTANACYGFYPALDERAGGPLFTVERDGEGWSLFAHATTGRQAFMLPVGFDPQAYQQFRFRKSGGRLTFQLEAVALGEVEADAAPTRVGLFARGASAAFEMVRVTAIVDNM